MGAARRAVVSIPVLDVRPRPSHRAELTSQLLLGEAVRIVGADESGWLRVESIPDGYAGWVRRWGLVLPRRSRTAPRRQKRNLMRVRVAFTEVRDAPGLGRRIMPLSLGARLVARSGVARLGWVGVKLPDGQPGWVPARDLAAEPLGAEAVWMVVDQLLGVPYLWGGRTPLGMDCSGFVQVALSMCGLELPRDAHDQWRATRRLTPGEKPRGGDLVFFSTDGRRMTHVGIYAGNFRFVHARGMVHFAGLKPGKQMYDKALVDQVSGFGRLVPG